MQESRQNIFFTQQQAEDIKQLKRKFNEKKQLLEKTYKQNFKIDINRIQNKHGNYITYITSSEYKQVDSTTVNRYLQCGLQIQKYKLIYLEKQNSTYNKIANRLSQQIQKNSKVMQDAQNQYQTNLQKISSQIKQYEHQITQLKKSVQKGEESLKSLLAIKEQIRSLPNFFLQQIKIKSLSNKQIARQNIECQVHQIIAKTKQLIQQNQALKFIQQTQPLKMKLKQQESISPLKINLDKKSQQNERLKRAIIQKQAENLALKKSIQKLTGQILSLEALIQKQRIKNTTSFEKCKQKILSLRQKRDEQSYELELLAKKKDQQILDLKANNNFLKTEKQNILLREKVLQDNLQKANLKKNMYKLAIGAFNESAKKMEKEKIMSLKIVIQKINSLTELLELEGEEISINHQQILQKYIPAKLQLVIQKLNAKRSKSKNQQSKSEQQLSSLFKNQQNIERSKSQGQESIPQQSSMGLLFYDQCKQPIQSNSKS